MYNLGDVVDIQGIKHIVSNSRGGFFLDAFRKENDFIFRKLGIEYKYEFCGMPNPNDGVFPFHDTIEQLNITIQKLLNYGKYDNDFYINMMKHE